MNAIAALILFSCPGAAQEPPGPAEAELFETKIRPLLAERCYRCHSARAEKLKGGLTLDSREGLMRGGDSGPAVAPGDPGKSLLVRAIRWTDADLKMPPKGKLAPEEISRVEAWIQGGAYWPGSASAPARRSARQVGLSVEAGRRFWAYRPLARRAPPPGSPGGVSGEIDAYIRGALAPKGLQPSPEADPAVLLRRLSFDLVGLPPSPEEIDRFLADRSPDAYDREVDRLLASPRFGERWGRHWLDLARFAESLTLRGFLLPAAWRYRDYVIDAFNRDVPFDRFVREQVAGDLLPWATVEERRRNLIAVSFLLLGNTNLEEQDKKQLEMDVVDEELDTLGRAFLAQTIGCARCHDHKFDPIPTRDYYALAGILKNSRVLEHANVSKHLETPLPVEPQEEEAIRQAEAAVAALQARIGAEKAKRSGPDRRDRKATGVLALSDVAGIVVDDEKAQKVGDWKHSTHSGVYIGSGYLHDDARGKGEKSLTFHPELAAGTYEVRFAYSPGPSRARNVPVTILSVRGEKTVVVNEQEEPPIGGRFVSLGQYRFENNQGFVMVSNEGTQGHVTADAVVFLPAGELARPRSPERGAGTLSDLEAELRRLTEAGPRRERVMALREEEKPGDLRIHLRGSVHTLGEIAPRGVLEATQAGAGPSIPPGSGGRRELADWIASRENPLTARVIVNRVWHWLLGAGLVRTTDNFGTTGELPSHPELLDALAERFTEQGWSIKRLVRDIVLSRTYRQAALGPEEVCPADPENRLLRGVRRRRLEAEELRDLLLVVAGRLDLGTPRGPTYPASLGSDYGYKAPSLRRSVYLPVFRNSLPEMLALFDFADPSVSTGVRNESTVPSQALFLMNSPFVLELARAAARRLLAGPPSDGPARLVRAYRLVLGRRPTEGETAVALGFSERSPGAEDSWASVFHALFASPEIRFLR